jgi:hypothetical protein
VATWSSAWCRGTRSATSCARLRADLSAYKVPKHLWVCAKSDLPFLQSGKIKKQELPSS